MLAVVLSLLPLLVVAVLRYAATRPDTLRIERNLVIHGRLTWSMQGPSVYMTKLMGVFFDMDRMIGRDFETGLAALQVQSEK